jgi:hypothetical protein
MSVAAPDGDQTDFHAVIFPDSVVQIETGSDKAWRYLRRRGVPADPATMGSVKTDTVYLTHDIDGSGKADYVVRESRLGPNSAMKDYRVAIYIDSDPGSRHPAWAMDWDWESGYNQALGTSMEIGPDQWLLDVASGGGDYDADEVLIVQHGAIRKVISHGVDYRNGYINITKLAGRVVVEATLDHLEVAGSPITSDIKCPQTEWRAIRLIFDPTKSRFTPERAFCAKLPRDAS